MKTMLLAVVSVVAVLASGCGGGACVVPSATGHVGWDACHDNWGQAECSDRQGTFHNGGTCSALGYTQACPADGSNTYRLPSYGC